MQIIKKYYKNWLLLVIGIILLAIGSTFFSASLAGSDSILTLSQGIANILHISLGWANIICNVVFLILTIIFNRKALGEGSVLMVVCIGLLINLFTSLEFIPIATKLWMKILYVLIANVICAMGLAMYIYANRGLSPFEGVLMAIKKKIKWPLWIVKIINDATFYLIGFLLGAVVNFGSIITMIIYGPLMDLFLKLLKKTNFIKEENNQ